MWFEEAVRRGAVGVAASVLLVFFLAGPLATAAWPRMYAPYRGHRIVPAGAAPLDTFTQPSGAYSFRKLRSAYGGPAIRLRRASDNLEADIGFLGFVPGLGSPIDTAQANAHCNATTCFIAKWYDQSGNAVDLPQAASAQQPSYVANCVNSLPCLQTTSNWNVGTVGNVTPATGKMTASVVAKTSASMTCTLINVGVQKYDINTGAPNVWILWNGSAGINAAAADTVWHAGAGVINGAASVNRIDAAETTGTLAPSATAGALYLGFPSGSAATCRLGEVVWWDNYALTVGERGILQANQKSFWGTP